MEKLNEFLNQYKLPLVLSFVGLVLIIGGIFSSGLLSKPKDFPQASLIENNKEIKIDVSGAVNMPGVYSLSAGSRVEDAIAASGGFSQEYNPDYVSKSLNLSQKLSDGQKIYIPYDGESYSGGTSMVAGISTEKIGINSSTQPQLEELPGVGPATAQKIIASRPYQDLAELYIKKIISKNLFEKIKESIDLN